MFSILYFLFLMKYHYPSYSSFGVSNEQIHRGARYRRLRDCSGGFIGDSLLNVASNSPSIELTSAEEFVRAAVHQLHEREAASVLQPLHVCSRTKWVHRRRHSMDAERFRARSSADDRHHRKGEQVSSTKTRTSVVSSRVYYISQRPGFSPWALLLVVHFCCIQVSFLRSLTRKICWHAANSHNLIFLDCFHSYIPGLGPDARFDHLNLAITSMVYHWCFYGVEKLLGPCWRNSMFLVWNIVLMLLVQIFDLKNWWNALHKVWRFQKVEFVCYYFLRLLLNFLILLSSVLSGELLRHIGKPLVTSDVDFIKNVFKATRQKGADIQFVLGCTTYSTSTKHLIAKAKWMRIWHNQLFPMTRR